MKNHFALIRTNVLILFLFLSYSSGQEFKRFGIESGFSFCNTAIDVPGVYKDAGVSATGGNSIDYGVGGYCYTTQFFRLDLGGHYWRVPFNPSYVGTFTVDSSRIDGVLNENGAIDYLAIYCEGLFETRYAFIGIGMDISFSNWYSADIFAFNTSGKLVARAPHAKQSFLTDKFNNRTDINLKAGFKIPISFITIRPTVSFALPTSPLFDTHVTVYDPYFETTSTVNFTAFTIKYGVWLSYSL